MTLGRVRGRASDSLIPYGKSGTTHPPPRVEPPTLQRVTLRTAPPRGNPSGIRRGGRKCSMLGLEPRNGLGTTIEGRPETITSHNCASYEGRANHMHRHQKYQPRAPVYRCQRHYNHGIGSRDRKVITQKSVAKKCRTKIESVLRKLFVAAFAL